VVAKEALIYQKYMVIKNSMTANRGFLIVKIIVVKETLLALQKGKNII
jgi:hypothetical protein